MTLVIFFRWSSDGKSSFSEATVLNYDIISRNNPGENQNLKLKWFTSSETWYEIYSSGFRH